MGPELAALIKLQGARVGGQHVQVDGLAGAAPTGGTLGRAAQVRQQAVQQQGRYPVAPALPHLPTVCRLQLMLALHAHSVIFILHFKPRCFPQREQ